LKIVSKSGHILRLAWSSFYARVLDRLFMI